MAYFTLTVLTIFRTDEHLCYGNISCGLVPRVTSLEKFQEGVIFVDSKYV